MKVINIVGARPNFMKISPIVGEMRKFSEFDACLVHTGQHYDTAMSKLFFEELGLPQPDIFLGVGSANHGEQTGKIMIALEKVLIEERPDLIVVVGDVNSTIACGLVAVKQGIKLAHVEAGLRSFDRSMPEEINRVLTDQISDILFTTEKSAEQNLLREGIDIQKIHFVGNVMIDCLFKHLQTAQTSGIQSELGIQAHQYAILTLHRPSNVDNREQFAAILKALRDLQAHIPIVFPIHPRSRERLRRFGLAGELSKMQQLLDIEPLGYLDFLKLISEAKFVLTDSGGIQEETTVLGVPCLTLRENTERPVTVAQGTNLIVGSHPDRILEASFNILKGNVKTGERPELWDGKAAERIVRLLLETFSS